MRPAYRERAQRPRDLAAEQSEPAGRVFGAISATRAGGSAEPHRVALGHGSIPAYQMDWHLSHWRCMRLASMRSGTLVTDGPLSSYCPSLRVPDNSARLEIGAGATGCKPASWHAIAVLRKRSWCAGSFVYESDRDRPSGSIPRPNVAVARCRDYGQPIWRQAPSHRTTEDRVLHVSKAVQ